ncbi:MAG: response regulator [Myxococcota bacterium]
MSEPRTPPRTILVVDDNRDAVLLLSRMLARWGHTVHTAHDGAGAVQMADEHRPDVVLLDIGLPVMDGYEVAEKLQSLDPPYQGTLVALTGYGKEEDLARAEQAGFTRHLLKPVDLGVLSRLLAELP